MNYGGSWVSDAVNKHNSIGSWVLKCINQHRVNPLVPIQSLTSPRIPLIYHSYTNGLLTGLHPSTVTFLQSILNTESRMTLKPVRPCLSSLQNPSMVPYSTQSKRHWSVPYIWSSNPIIHEFTYTTNPFLTPDTVVFVPIFQRYSHFRALLQLDPLPEIVLARYALGWLIASFKCLLTISPSESAYFSLYQIL